MNKKISELYLKDNEITKNEKLLVMSNNSINYTSTINSLEELKDTTIIDTLQFDKYSYTQTELNNILELIGTKNTIFATRTKRYKITNYDSSKVYNLIAINGLISLENGVVSYTSSNIIGPGGFIINGRIINLEIIANRVLTPTILSPIPNSINIHGSVDIEASLFQTTSKSSGYLESHVSSDWQLATDPDFNTIVQQVSNSESFRKIWNLFNLNVNTNYYVRVRFKGYTSGYSQWSPIITFRTKNSFSNLVETSIISASSFAWIVDRKYNIFHISKDGTRIAVYTNKIYTSFDFPNNSELSVYKKTNGIWSLEYRNILEMWPYVDQYYYHVPHSLTVSEDLSTIVLTKYIRRELISDIPNEIITYRRINDVWSLVNKKSISITPMSICISPDGLRLAISFNHFTNAVLENNNKSITIYLFDNVTNVWNIETDIFENDIYNQSIFGDSLSFNSDGSILAVSSTTSKDSNNEEVGSVYIYNRLGTTWSLSTKIQPLESNGYFLFGSITLISYDGSTLVVKSSKRNVDNSYSYKVAHVYDKVNDNWVLNTVLEASDRNYYDTFGTSISITNNGDKILISAISSNFSNLVAESSTTGVVYLYNRVNNIYEESTRIIPSNSSSIKTNYFGYCTGISGIGDSIAVLTNYDSYDAWKVYVFN